MKLSILALPLILIGCVSQQPTAQTINESQVKTLDFVTSLIILDCAYQHQGCEHAEGFATCTYHLKNSINAMSPEQINVLEQNLRTQFGFEKKSDSEINDAADMILARYLACKK